MTYVAFTPNPRVVASLSKPLPPGPFGVLSGLMGLLGLGATYEEQLAAYEKDLKRWKEEEVAHDYAMAMYENQVQGIDYSYQRAMSDYTSVKLPAYNTAYAAYQSKMSIYNQQKAGYDQTKSAMTAEYQRLAKAAATKYGLTLPAGFVCISPQAKAYYDTWDCTVVKGIDGYSLYGGTTGCAARNLPVCNFPLAPAHPGSPPLAPVKPVKGKYPTKPPALRPQPTPPTPTQSSDVLPPPVTSMSPPPAEEPAKKMSMVKGGLIAVVVVAGGVALYRTFKKPKGA